MAHVSPHIHVAILAARFHGVAFLLSGAALVLVVVAALDQGAWFRGSRLPFVLDLVIYFGAGALFLFLAWKMDSAALWTFVVTLTVASFLTLLLLAVMLLRGVVGPCCSHFALVLSGIHVVARCWWALPELRFYDPSRRRGVGRRTGFEPIVKPPAASPAGRAGSASPSARGEAPPR